MGGRGMMTEHEERNRILLDSKEAQENGARICKISQVIGLSSRTLQRWQHSDTDQRPLIKKISPKALTQEEKEAIIEVCNQHEYMDMTPNKIVPTLAEKGQYIASESMFYRVLKENNQLKHRNKCKEPKKRPEPATLIANGPNQLLSWDITYLKTSVRGIFFYLYLFMDVYSRKIMGWRIEEEENGEIAKIEIEKICDENNLKDIYLHSDNGAPMKSGTLLSTLQFLGITASFSRPSVSNDNPYSESLFKTMKYKVGYPDCFDTIEEAREWVNRFVKWYNNEHLHSSIKFVTPEQRHTGADKEILAKRNETYLKAKEKNPMRWSRKTRDWSYIDRVELRGSVKLIEPKKLA